MWVFFAVKANFLLYYIWRFPANPADFNGVVGGRRPHWGRRPHLDHFFFGNRIA